MALYTRLLPFFALAFASPVVAQTLITPLEQDRHLSITLSGMSAGAQAVYILESEAETFGPFYAGIEGELNVETAQAHGIGGHYSLIRPDGFVIEQSTNADAMGMFPDDTAGTLADCTFRVVFSV